MSCREGRESVCSEAVSTVKRTSTHSTMGSGGSKKKRQDKNEEKKKEEEVKEQEKKEQKKEQKKEEENKKGEQDFSHQTGGHAGAFMKAAEEGQIMKRGFIQDSLVSAL